jgi:hypothetical protein
MMIIFFYILHTKMYLKRVINLLRVRQDICEITKALKSYTERHLQSSKNVSHIVTLYHLHTN